MCKKHDDLRQVSFLEKEVARWLAHVKSKEDGLCLKRFRSDHIAEGVTTWKEGDVVEVEGTFYEITMLGKRCFSECLLLQREGRPCPLKEGVAFGRMKETRE